MPEPTTDEDRVTEQAAQVAYDAAAEYNGTGVQWADGLDVTREGYRVVVRALAAAGLLASHRAQPQPREQFIAVIGAEGLPRTVGPFDYASDADEWVTRAIGGGTGSWHLAPLHHPAALAARPEAHRPGPEQAAIELTHLTEDMGLYDTTRGDTEETR